jgi:hypothetical protein
MPEKTTPMTVSCFTRLNCRSRKPVAKAQTMPAAKAPTTSGMADDVGEHHARQHGVADRIAHQRPALQHQKHDSMAAGTATSSEMRNAFCMKGNWNGRSRDSAHDCGLRRGLQCGPAARASSPCLGANTKASRKIRVCSTTMTPPVAPSRK